jgi:hypothetical protein
MFEVCEQQYMALDQVAKTVESQAYGLQDLLNKVSEVG